MKTGTISGTMVCSESQYQSIPYRGHIHGSITVMGRQTVCLRCGDMGHQRSTCPHKPAKSYAAATRGDNQEEWQTVGSSRLTLSTTNQVESVQPEVPVRTEEEKMLHCDEWDRVVALPRHKFVTGATLLQLGYYNLL